MEWAFAAAWGEETSRRRALARLDSAWTALGRCLTIFAPLPPDEYEELVRTALSLHRNPSGSAPEQELHFAVLAAVKVGRIELAHEVLAEMAREDPFCLGAVAGSERDWEGADLQLDSLGASSGDGSGDETGAQPPGAPFDEARRHYKRFVHWWGNADPELQPLVEEARRWIARLEETGRADVGP